MKTSAFVFLSLFFLFITQWGTAAPSAPALPLNKSIRLSEFRGSKTFFEALSGPGGIKANIDEDDKNLFNIADTKRAMDIAKENFDPTVYRKMIRNLVAVDGDREKSLEKLLSAFPKDRVTPETFKGLVTEELTKLKIIENRDQFGLTRASLAAVLSLVSGAGTVVHIDDSNYIYNVGYLPGSAAKSVYDTHVKSGRSFGASRVRRALDPSDRDYLREMDAFLRASKDPTEFFAAILDLILECDADGLGKLQGKLDGETVVTDFVAIYIAELTRYAMTQFKEHDWQNHLAEATFLTAWGSKLGEVEENGEIVKGTAEEYFGVGTQGSGIGGRKGVQRRGFQALVTNAERTLHPDVVKAVDQQIDGAGHEDVISEFMKFVNNPKNQAKVKARKKELKSTFLAFLDQIHEDAADIDKIINR
jgi:hypothetical protein